MRFCYALSRPGTLNQFTVLAKPPSNTAAHTTAIAADKQKKCLSIATPNMSFHIKEHLTEIDERSKYVEWNASTND